MERLPTPALDFTLVSPWSLAVRVSSILPELYAVQVSSSVSPTIPTILTMRCSLPLGKLWLFVVLKFTLSSLANLSQNNARHVGDLKQRRLQDVQ